MLNEHINQSALIKIYHIGQVVDDLVDTREIQICSGQVAKIISDSEMELMIKEEPFPELKKEICYMLHIYTAESLYRCSIYYHSMYADEGKNYICVEVASPLEKIQRRMYQRVSCHSKIKMQPLEEAQVKELLENRTGNPLFATQPEQTESFEDSMVDISGGGIRFTTGRKVNFHDYLLVQFEILSGELAVELNIVGQVVYSNRMPNNQKCYDIRMKYVGLSEQEREQIICFAFRLERDAMKKNWN